ncbi:carbohydrate ABC transporter permease [Micromonosporaceae bacterium Da 78-11]
MIDSSVGSRQGESVPYVATASRTGRGSRRSLHGFAFVAPAMTVVAGLFVVPLGILIFMSFMDWPLISNDVHPNGVANYTDILSNDVLLSALKFTVVYTILTTVLVFGTSFVLVAVASSRRRAAKFYRTAYFLPYVVGTAAAALLWYVDLDDQLGVLNRILLGLHLIDQPAALLSTPTKATFSAIALVVWKFVGFQVIVLLVGLQAIPVELYEAAKMDGASTWHRLRFITVPMLKPTLALLLVLSVTGSVLAFDQFYVLTQGGPDNSTITLVYALYQTAFTHFKLGAAAAMSVVLLLTLVLLNGVQLRLLRERNRT